MQAGVAKAGVDSKKVKVFTRDGVHMNSAGNVMMATGILKGFGLNEEQIAKAQKVWAELQEPAQPPKAAAPRKAKKE